MTTPSSWTNISFLKASTPVANSFMGNASAVYENIAVLGAPSENGNTGAVYIFSKNTTTGVWSQQQKLVGAVSGDNFGNSVSLYGDTLAIGAYSIGSDTVGEYVSIYRLSGTTWNLERKITNPNPSPAPAPGDNFGYAVSLYTDTLAICAPGYTTSPGNSEGAVYIYTRSGTTWTLQTTLTNSPIQNIRYAYSVSLYGTTLAVGAQFESTTVVNSGAVYLYTGSGTSWTQQQIIKAIIPVISSGFGTYVALYGDILAVGTLGSNTNGAYVFTRSGVTWTQRQILTPTTPSPGTASGFGQTVALYDTIVVVGAKFDNGNATGVNGSNTGTLTGAGATYAYVTVDAGVTWTQNAYMKASATPTPVANDNVATSVAIYGTIILAGAPGQDTGGSSSGAGYLYEPPFVGPTPSTSGTTRSIVVDPCCSFTNCIRVSLPTLTEDSVITETHEAKTILSATNALYAGINNGTITANPNPTFGSYREYMLYVQGKLKFVKG